MKQFYTLLGALAVALLMTFITPFFQPKAISANVSSAFDTDDAIIPQKVISTS